MNSFQPFRLFIALVLPDEVKTSLSDVQRELRKILPSGSLKISRTENLHLTLRFLGDVDSTRIGELETCLRAAVTGFGGMDLVCERLGCFPDLRYPRVVWAWVHDAADKLNLLEARLNEASASFSEKPPDERFVGHVTLARCRQIRRAEAEHLAMFVENAVGRKFGAWQCGELELIRSEMLPAGSRYTTLATIRLGGNSK